MFQVFLAVALLLSIFQICQDMQVMGQSNLQSGETIIVMLIKLLELFALKWMQPKQICGPMLLLLILAQEILEIFGQLVIKVDVVLTHKMMPEFN
jgi:hypothetical protein